MSMFDDVMGIGRSSVLESMNEETFEPEIEATSLEEAADIEGDVMDCALQMAYENEMNMMKLDAAIVAEEYIYLRENGQEMVAEAGTIESIVNKAKSMVQAAWAKIQSFFKEVMKKVDEGLKLDDRFIKKYEDKVKGKSAKVKGSKDLVKPGAIYDKAKGIFEDIKGYAKYIYDHVDDKKPLADSDVEKHLKFNVTGNGTADATEFLKAMIDGYKAKDSAEVNVTAKEAIEGFRAGKTAKANLKDAYTKNKDAINIMLKGLKKYETSAKKWKVVSTDQSKKIHVAVKQTNKCITYLTMTNRAYVKAINLSRSFCKAAIIAAASEGAKKPEVKIESNSMIDALEF